jgi:fatty-acyl-CoA synthase
MHGQQEDLVLGHSDGMIQIAANMRRNALRYRDRLAFIAGSERITWHEADQVSDRLAYRLRELGIGRGDHVAVLGNNTPTYILVTYALFKLGATAVILNAALRGDHLKFQLNHAETKAIISGDGMQQFIDEVRSECCASLFMTWDAQETSAGVINLDATVSDTRPVAPFPIVAVDPDDIACLVFSSGTTGTPKGAINTYWNLFAKNVSLGFSQELTQSDIGLLITPLCMGGTQLMSINPYVMLGMTSVITTHFDAAETLRLIESERVTTTFCVPTMINAMTSLPEYRTRDLVSFTKIISAGSPLPHEVYLRLCERNIGVLECYGTSETGGGVMISAAEKAGNPKSVGRPMVGFEVQIFDDEDRPVVDGEVGEFVIRGAPVAKGYYKQPEIQAETYRSGWFHTGDLGRRDKEGFLYVTDRKKDMVKSGGINVYPKDIEEVLYQLPGLAECAVVGLPHNHWGEAVAAFIVKRDQARLDEAAVLDKLKATLANYQIPKAVVFVDELPKTPFGKLSKLKLREDYAAYFRESHQ